MSVVVFVVTHGPSGIHMIEAVEHLGGKLSNVYPIVIEIEDRCENIEKRIDQLLADSQDEPLFIIDLIGSTPERLCAERCMKRGAVLGGLNLAMLMKLVTADRNLGATQLARELASSGSKSIYIKKAPALKEEP